MAQSIKLGSDTFLDGSGVEMNSSTGAYRQTLAEWARGLVGTDAVYIGANSSVTLSLKSDSSMIMFSIGASGAICGIYAIICTSGGVSNFFSLVDASSFTVSRSSNTITIANSNSNSARLRFLIYSGGISSTT